MNTIKLNDLVILDIMGSGSFSVVREVAYKDRLYSFKEMVHPDSLLDEETQDKLNEISKLALKRSILPVCFVADKDKTIGYLTEKNNPKTYSYLYSIGEDRKIVDLKQSKFAVEELHNNGIIHADIHSSNILLRSQKIIDFDNSQYNGYKLNQENLCIDAKEYIKHFGIDKTLDIYLHNLMTFAILNNMSEIEALLAIDEENYNYFTSKKSIEICKSMNLSNNIRNEKYLIDTVNYVTEDNKRMILRKKWKR